MNLSYLVSLSKMIDTVMLQRPCIIAIQYNLIGFLKFEIDEMVSPLPITERRKYRYNIDYKVKVDAESFHFSLMIPNAYLK